MIYQQLSADAEAPLEATIHVYGLSFFYYFATAVEETAHFSIMTAAEITDATA